MKSERWKRNRAFWKGIFIKISIFVFFEHFWWMEIWKLLWTALYVIRDRTLLFANDIPWASVCGAWLARIPFACLAFKMCSAQESANTECTWAEVLERTPEKKWQKMIPLDSVRNRTFNQRTQQVCRKSMTDVSLERYPTMWRRLAHFFVIWTWKGKSCLG